MAEQIGGSGPLVVNSLAFVLATVSRRTVCLRAKTRQQTAAGHVRESVCVRQMCPCIYLWSDSLIGLVTPSIAF